jgi:hypothetical protein
VMHSLLLVASQLKGLADSHYHKRNQESSPES